MLSHNDLDKRIVDGKVKLWYHFLPKASGGLEVHQDGMLVDLNDSDNPATKFYRDHMDSTHLRLTAGPIVKTHHPSQERGRQRHLHFHTYFNLLSQNNEIQIAPHESVSIATNERIALDGKTAALVTPRVKNTDSGLILTTAYIDPHYDGIMRVVITNMTPNWQTLRVLEPIAQCFFFNLLSAVDKEFKDRFPRESEYYGQNWKQLLNSAVDPFPLSKVPLRSATLIEKVKAGFTNILPKVVAFLGVTGFLAIVGGLIYVGQLMNRLEGYDALKTRVDSLTKHVESTDAMKVMSGYQLISVPARATEGRAHLTVPIPSTASPRVWVQIDRAAGTMHDDAILSYAIMPGTTAGETKVELIVRFRRAKDIDRGIPVLWMITR